MKRTGTWRRRRGWIVGAAIGLLGIGACGGPSTAELISRAEAAADDGRLRAAVIDLRNAVASEPQNPQARYRLAIAALELGDAATAEKELRRARELGYEMAPTVEPMAASLILLNRPREALAELQGFEPVTGEVEALRGDAWAVSRNDEAALAAYGRALEIDADNERALLGTARYALAKGDRDSASDAYERALAAHPQSPQVRLGWGRFLYSAGRVAEAEEQFKAGLALPLTGQRVQDRWELQLSLAEAYMAQSKLDEAEAAIATLNEIRRDHVLVKYLSARLAFEKRELIEADELISRVVVEAPQFSPGLMLKGTVKLARGEYGQARQALQRVIDMNPADAQARKLLAAAERGLSQARESGSAPELSDSDVLQLLGDANAQTGDYGNAIVLWERALEQDPDDVQIKMQLISAYVLAGRTERARELLESSDWTDDGNAQRAAILDATLDLREGDLEQAARKVDAAIERYPQAAPLYGLQGLIKLRGEDTAGARASFERALAVDPGHTTSAMNLAALATRDGRPEQAVALLETFVESNPGDSMALNALATQLLAQGKTEAGRKRLEQARDADPKNVAARLQLAELMARSSDFSNAEAVAREVIEQRPRFAGGYNTLAIAQLGQGRTEEARESLRTALRIDPQAREPLRNLLRLEFQAGEATQARQTAERLLEVAPEDVVGLEIGARLAIGDSRFDDAEELLARLVAAAPESTVVTDLVLRGDIAAGRGEIAQAASLYERAYAQNESSAIVERLYRVRVAQQSEAPEQVLVDWVAANPEDSRVRLMLAQHLQSRGRSAQAVPHYERLLSAAPQSVAVLNNLALAYVDIGDGRALETAQKASDLAPDAVAVQDTYGWILVLEGQVDNGVALLRDAWAAAPQVGDIGYHLAEGLARSGASEEARTVLQQTLADVERFPTRELAQALLDRLESET